MGQLFSALQLSFISKRLESVHAARAQWCNQRTLTQKALMTQYNRYKVVACFIVKGKSKQQFYESFEDQTFLTSFCTHRQNIANFLLTYAMYSESRGQSKVGD